MNNTLVDSNILIYSIHKREGKKHDVAAEVINQLIDRDELILSVQNLVEFSRVLADKSFPSIDKELIRQHVFELSESAIVIQYSSHTIMDALLLSKQYDVHFFDALLATTMQENGIEKIITENDKNFSKIPWLKVENPLKGIKK